MILAFLLFAFSCANTGEARQDLAGSDAFDHLTETDIFGTRDINDESGAGEITQVPVWEAAQESMAVESHEVSQFPDETPSVIIIHDPETGLPVDLTEPFFSLPEIYVLMPEPDQGLLGLLPEPSLPELFTQDPFDLEPISEDISVITQPDIPREQPIYTEPPQPPPFLRPPEQEIPQAPREQMTLPIEPLPEPPARIIPSPSEEVIVFSRVVRATVGQLVEIPFRGTGWVFLGEIGSRRGISFESRRLDSEGQSFIFRTETPGTYVLRFYRQDFLRDYVINDHVQVIIGEAPDISGTGLFSPPMDRGRVIAEPRWPLLDQPPAAPPVPAPGTATPPLTATPAAPPVPAPGTAMPPPAATPTAPPEDFEGDVSEYMIPDEGFESISLFEDPVPVQEPLRPDELLRRAREEFNGGRIETALSFMDRLSANFPGSMNDEALWILGQLYEANSPLRDIRLSLDYYNRLTREYPQSLLVQEARRRIAFLERFYFNIR